MPVNVMRKGNELIFVRGFLESERCRELIQFSDHEGYEPAKINVGQAEQQVVTDVRNNERLFWDNHDLAEDWFNRAREHFPVEHTSWEPSGLNERFRFYRYKPGARFAPHRDGSYQRNANEMSWYTIMVYLNDDFEGGQTRFSLAGKADSILVEPDSGAALIFKHDLLNEGCPVISGTKYVLRTDVMYRRVA